MVRHPDELPPHPVSGIGRVHPRRERYRHRGELGFSATLAADDVDLRPYHCHAHESLGPVLQGSRARRRYRRRPADRGCGAYAAARSATGQSDSHSSTQDARRPRARRRAPLAQHRKKYTSRRYRADRRSAGRRLGPGRDLYAPSPRSLLWSAAEPRLPHGLSLQRDSHLQRKHAAGVRERRLRQFDADAAHRSGLRSA